MELTWKVCALMFQNLKWPNSKWPPKAFHWRWRQIKQGSILVGCVPPTFLVLLGGCPTSLDAELSPLWCRPPPPGCRPPSPGCRPSPPWMQIPSSWMQISSPPGCRPSRCKPPHDLDADPLPLVMWPVMHAGKPIPPCEQKDTGVKKLPCPKLRSRAVTSKYHKPKRPSRYG